MGRSMSIQIVASSPQAEEIRKNPNAVVKTGLRTRYPFDKLEIGQSFTLPKAEANLKSIRLIASRKSKDGKRFEVLEHETPPVVEVARIA